MSQLLEYEQKSLLSPYSCCHKCADELQEPWSFSSIVLRKDISALNTNMALLSSAVSKPCEAVPFRVTKALNQAARMGSAAAGLLQSEI